MSTFLPSRDPPHRARRPCRDRVRALRRPGRRPDPPQRQLRRRPRALQGNQPGVPAQLEAAGRRGRHGQPVARRLEQAGALGDRRPRGRRRDDEPVERHRRHRARQADSRGLGQATAQQRRADDLGHRDPGPQGQSQGHPRLARPRQGGNERRHPEPEDHRQRPLHLRRGLGLGDQGRRHAGAGEGAGAEDLRQRAGVRRRRPRRDDDLRAAQHRRCPVHLRERGQPDQGRVRRQLRGRLSEVDDPGREPGRA